MFPSMVKHLQSYLVVIIYYKDIAWVENVMQILFGTVQM